MFKRLLLPLCLLLAGFPVAAEEYLLALDPEASQVSFTLGATLHTVHGTARLARGQIRFDLETGSISGEIVVDATSAETGNKKRDKDMHKKVLESATYPEIVLVPQHFDGTVELAGRSELTLHALLRIHGGEHPVELPVTLETDGDHLQAATHFVVPYVAWGMKNPSKLLLRVKKTVEITIEAVGTLIPQPEETTSLS